MYIIKRDHALPYLVRRGKGIYRVTTWSSRLEDACQYRTWIQAMYNAIYWQNQNVDKSIRIGNAEDGSDALVNIEYVKESK